MSGIINKIKDAVHSDKHSAPEGTHGPHNSRVANAADPRVDSDRDGSHHTTGNTMTGMTGRTAGHGETGSANPFTSNTHSTTGNTFGTHSAGTHSEGAHGPHTSRVANAADPRVDSDRDGSRTMGTTGTGTTGLGSSNTHHAHAGQGVTGMTGTHGAPAGTYGPHGSRVANAADPRVDSDRDGRGAIHSGPGPADNTAGPHKSDMMNKMDPRVDSDLDGSKTMGQQQTFQ